MKHNIARFLMVVLLAGVAATLTAQSSPSSPPKVLVVSREFLKPGKAGSPHQKTESMFVQAMTAAKWPTHYLGTDAMTGPSRAVFFTGYDSLDAWGKDMTSTFGNPTLSAAIDRAFIADGELLSSYDSNVFSYRPDLSYEAAVSIPDMRYFEVTVFRTKPGHEMEWEEIAKMYVQNFVKALPGAHWATYQMLYGSNNGGGVYVVIVPVKSMAELDAGWAAGEKFMQQLGESGMKKMMELSAASTLSTEANVLVFNPAISYVSDDWIKADPGFWKPRAATSAKKPAAKPEPKPAQ